MKYFKILRKAVFIFIYLSCILISTEVILRIASHFYSRTPELNEFRDRTFNILCFGDSFTYGWGVEPQNTYPAQLEKMLNESNLDNKRFKVFNLGIPGSNSSQILKYFKQILEKYKKPDLVIVLTGANDSWNFADSNIYKFIKKGSPQRRSTRLKIILSKLRIYKMLKLISLNIKGRPSESDLDCFKIIQKYENVDVNILKRLLEYNLTQMIKLANANEIKIILHNYPRGDLYGAKLTKKIAEPYNVPFIDNYSAFKERLEVLNYQDLFQYDISHPNKQGYRIMAEKMDEVISEIINVD